MEYLLIFLMDITFVYIFMLRVNINGKFFKEMIGCMLIQ